MTKVIVTFEKNWRGYAAGETAGFDSAIAEGLIESGYAVESGKQSAKKGKSGPGNATPTGKPSDGGGNADADGKVDDQASDDGKP